MEVLRFVFNGLSGEFTRTPQGFLRVNARLTKAGIFSYQNSREYRGEEEVFCEDSLASLQGAPITDLHPSEKSDDELAEAAFKQAYWAALSSGSSVLMSENGNLVEIFPDGKRKVIKPLPPSTPVIPGQRLVRS